MFLKIKVNWLFKQNLVHQYISKFFPSEWILYLDLHDDFSSNFIKFDGCQNILNLVVYLGKCLIAIIICWVPRFKYIFLIQRLVNSVLQTEENSSKEKERRGCFLSTSSIQSFMCLRGHNNAFHFHQECNKLSFERVYPQQRFYAARTTIVDLLD